MSQNVEDFIKLFKCRFTIGTSDIDDILYISDGFSWQRVKLGPVAGSVIQANGRLTLDLSSRGLLHFTAQSYGGILPWLCV